MHLPCRRVMKFCLFLCCFLLHDYYYYSTLDSIDVDKLCLIIWLSVINLFLIHAFVT